MTDDTAAFTALKTWEQGRQDQEHELAQIARAEDVGLGFPGCD